MATHSSILAWRIPWTEDADGQKSMRLQKSQTRPSRQLEEQPRQHIKKQRHHFSNKGLSSQSYGFSSSHVWMSKWNNKESWALKN